jgi:predicted RND superfamily exporter protein
MSSPSQRITSWLVQWRWPLLVVGVILAVLSWPASRQLSFDRSIDNMFAEDDPLLVPFQRLKRTFGGDEVVLAVYADDELLAPDHRGIRRLATVTDRLEKVPGVAAVLSLDRMLVDDPNVDDKEDREFLPLDDGLGKAAVELFEGHTHGADGRTAAVACMLVPMAQTEVPRRQCIDDLREVIESLPDGVEPGMLAGEPVMVSEGFRFVEEDGRRLGIWSTVLLAITIILCFRSFRWVVIPIAVVQLTLLLTKAALVWSGLQLSMVSSMLTAIVTVVGIATVMHVIVRFRDARQTGLPPRDALVQAGGLIAVAIFWACTTDAAGFAALQTARVGPVQDFGLMMAIGSLLVIVSVALVVPGLALLGGIADDPRRAWGEGLLDAQLSWLIRRVEARPKLTATVLLLAGVAAAAGTFRLTVESDFTRNFRENSSIVKSYKYVEDHLGGAGVWDVMLPAPEQLDWAYLERILELEDRLRTEVVLPKADELAAAPQPGLTKVISLADVIQTTVEAQRRTYRKFMRFIPRHMADNFMLSKALDEMRARVPEFVAALHGEDPEQPGHYYMRIMLRSWERQPAEQKQQLIEQVRSIVRPGLPPVEEPTDDKALDDDTDEDSFAARASDPGEVTGYYVLLARLIESMLRDQWFTFGVAAAGITLMMLLALRDPRLALIALVPNALPILVVMGAMGWIGLKINMGAAMIAAVSLGLSVDSSIHYLTSFRRALRVGKSVHEALTEVQQTVGRAIVFSTIALIVGFLVLTTSDFVPTIYFGTLVSLAMAGGLAGNLVILPVLLKLFIWDKPNGMPQSTPSPV